MMETTIGDGFSFAAVGDLIGPFRPELPLQNPGFLAACRVLQGADVSFANQECTLLDVDHFPGYRAAENGGGYPVFPPEVAADLKAMGFDVLGKANNHATDWGVEGLLENLRILKAAGLTVAGAGRSRATARAPAVLETPRGRVAVISCATTFTPMSEAGEPHGEIGARPGISVIHLKEITLIPEAGWGVIERAAQSQGCNQSLDSRAHGKDGQIQLGREIFRKSDRHGMHYEVNPLDQEDLLRSVRQARQVYDFVVLAVHSHETLNGNGTELRPGDFLPVLLHEAVDAGADLVVISGPHLLRGVEVYRQRPIYYGLGSFFLQMEGGLPPTFEQMRALGVNPYRYTKPEFSRLLFDLPEEWFDSVITRSVFSAGRLARIELHPVLLERRLAPRLQGTPRLATGHEAERILAGLAEKSAAYGTDVRIENGIGVLLA
jgi:poly-gamma-glutamate capsule biosynthesis protein CapA/YwtB (metallophosphatase superfamily)